MMQLSMKTYVALLLGISALFSTESMSASIPETSSMNSTAEPGTTIKPPLSTHVAHNETETRPATLHPIHTPAEVSADATAETVSTATPTVGTEEAIITYKYDSSNDSATDLVSMTTAAATASSSGPRLPHISTAAGEASHSTMTSETAKPTEDQQPPTTTTDVTSSSSATIPATAAAAAPAAKTVSLPLTTSTPEPEVTSHLSSTFPADSTDTPVFTQNLSSSSTTTMTVNSTSEAPPVSYATTWPFTKSETSTNGAEISSTSPPVSVASTPNSMSEFTDTTGSKSTTDLSTISTDSANTITTISTTANVSTTANASTSSAGIIFPHVPRKLPISTTRSTPVTTISTSSTEVQPCSTRGVVKHCLIAIASLAGLATIFMVSTIVLCTKLSARKYKVKKPQPATEMMCISALLPERNYTYTRQRNPVTNGVLVIHGGGDSDEDGGDNLTLSSFLPDNDRYV